MSEWKPVETAPKDETRVLVFAPGEGIGLAEWSGGEYWKCAWGDYDWVDQGGDFSRIKCVRPTHWQPLPEPPAGA